MESKQGGVKKLIRIHLNAQRKAIQQRKLTALNAKSSTGIQLQKTIVKSPSTKLVLDRERPQKYPNLLSTGSRGNLPSLNTASIDQYAYKSSKMILEINPKVKSSSQIADIFTPREIVNKLKRIKSEQSMVTTEKNDFLKKFSKCKVLVKNPFQRKLSKNVNENFEQSQIVDNESNLSQSGCAELTNIIAFL